jgi:hypothetical protein
MTRAQCITSDGSQQRCHVSSCHLPASIEARAPREEDQSELVVGCAKEEEEGGEGEMFRENCCQGDHWKLVREGLARRLRTVLARSGLQVASEGGCSCGFPHRDPGCTDHVTTVQTRLECRAVSVSCAESQVGSGAGPQRCSDQIPSAQVAGSGSGD